MTPHPKAGSRLRPTTVGVSRGGNPAVEDVRKRDRKACSIATVVTIGAVKAPVSSLSTSTLTELAMSKTSPRHIMAQGWGPGSVRSSPALPNCRCLTKSAVSSVLKFSRLLPGCMNRYRFFPLLA